MARFPSQRDLTPKEQRDANDRAKRLVEAEAIGVALWLMRSRRIVEAAKWLSLGEIAQRLNASMAAQIAESRRLGGDAGVKALESELAGLKVGPAPPGAGMTPHSPVATSRRFVRRWLTVAESSDLPKGDAAEAATKVLEPQAKGIITTETSSGFSLSRKRAAEDAIRNAPPGVVVLERWDSVLDHVVCPNCEKADGETIYVGESFTEGIPGLVHPRCRCTSHYLYEHPETAWLLTR